MDDHLKQAAADYIVDRAKLDKKYNTDRDKLAAKNKGGAFFSTTELRGRAVYVQAEVRSTALSRFLDSNGLKIVDRRVEATVFVVQSPMSPGERILWRAVLVGGYLLTPDALMEGRGVAISWKSVLHMKRQVWLSPVFQHKNPVIAEIIKSTIAQAPRCKWHLLRGDVVAFRAAAGHSRSKGRRTETFGIIDKSEDPHPQAFACVTKCPNDHVK